MEENKNENPWVLFNKRRGLPFFSVPFAQGMRILVPINKSQCAWSKNRTKKKEKRKKGGEKNGLEGTQNVKIRKNLNFDFFPQWQHFPYRENKKKDK